MVQKLEEIKYERVQIFYKSKTAIFVIDPRELNRKFALATGKAFIKLLKKLED